MIANTAAGPANLRAILPIALGALLIMTTAACGQDPKDVTCSQFAAMSDTDQNDTLDHLLSDHDLETLSMSNTIGVRNEVDSYCGTSAFSKATGGTAKRNSGQSIDKAVDWDSKTWR